MLAFGNLKWPNVGVWEPEIMFNSRVLRRRWVLAVIFFFSLVYFGINVYKQREYVVVSEETPRLRQAMESFKFLDKTNSSDGICRNSVQGKHLIADDKGFVCKREAVLEGGCCDQNIAGVQQFVCDTCINNGCCSVYEHCVSCCLQPEKQPLLRKILGRASDKFQHLFQSVTDHFELCLAKCRTSSQSVQHENSYRDPVAKYCYGESPPDLQAVAP